MAPKQLKNDDYFSFIVDTCKQFGILGILFASIPVVFWMATASGPIGVWSFAALLLVILCMFAVAIWIALTTGIDSRNEDENIDIKDEQSEP